MKILPIFDLFIRLKTTVFYNPARFSGSLAFFALE